MKITDETTPELEAVARAIYENDVRTHQPPINNYPWDKQNETSRSVYRDMARAALSAIREPTERMLHAMGVDHAKDRYVPIQEQNIIDGFTAAIDSILSDTRTPTEGDLL